MLPATDLLKRSQLSALILFIVVQPHAGAQVNLEDLFSRARPAAPATAVIASLACNRLFDGSDAVLNLRANGRLATPIEPDYSLLATDFTILGVVFSNRDWLTPAGLSARAEWTVRLRPKRLGELPIPSLTIGSFRTEPLTLTVQVKRAADVAELAEHVRVEVEAVPAEPYVQAQVVYRVRMLYDERLQQGSLSEPVFASTFSHELGRHRSYTAERDGHRYQVSERRYALFPEKSGALVIPGPTFRGEVGYAGRSGRADTGCSSPLEFTLEPTVLKVRPRPPAYGERLWLPSEQIVLEARYPEAPAQLTLGEPLIGTFAISAKGLSADAIPDLSLPPIEGAHVYLGTRQTATEFTDDGVLSRWERAVTIVPGRAGELRLPEIRLPWWDTVQHRKRYATLPARTVLVVAGANAAPKVSALVLPAQTRWWLAGTLVLVVTAGLGFALARRLFKQFYRPSRARQAQRALARACERHDAAAAARAVLAWSAAVWPQQPPRSLGALGERLPAEREPLYALDRTLYSKQPPPWNGVTLRDRLLRPQRRRAKGRGAEPDLAPLYPERS